MDIEEQEKIISELYQLQNERRIILNSNKIIFRNDSKMIGIIDMYCSNFSDYSISIKESFIAQNYRDLVIKELDIKIKLLTDKLKNI